MYLLDPRNPLKRLQGHQEVPEALEDPEDPVAQVDQVVLEGQEDPVALVDPPHLSLEKQPSLLSQPRNQDFPEVRQGQVVLVDQGVLEVQEGQQDREGREGQVDQPHHVQEKRQHPPRQRKRQDHQVVQEAPKVQVALVDLEDQGVPAVLVDREDQGDQEALVVQEVPVAREGQQQNRRERQRRKQHQLGTHLDNPVVREDRGVPEDLVAQAALEARVALQVCSFFFIISFITFTCAIFITSFSFNLTWV